MIPGSPDVVTALIDKNTVVYNGIVREPVSRFLHSLGVGEKGRNYGSIVFLHLIKLSRSKATGLDNISAKIIRECADLISVSLCDLFNISGRLEMC